jgi:hypothetical protein
MAKEECSEYDEHDHEQKRNILVNDMLFYITVRSTSSDTHGTENENCYNSAAAFPLVSRIGPKLCGGSASAWWHY